MNYQTSREALLVLLLDGKACQNWLLVQETTTIGRREDNDVVIPDRWVSRYHAEVRREGTRYVIQDLGSKNGLFVNGKLATGPVGLEDGDQIQIAPRYQLVFADSEATAPLFEGTGCVLIDEDARRVWVQGHELEPALSSAQFDLLKALTSDPGRVFSRDELIAIGWPDADPSGISRDALDSLIRRLRKRLMSAEPSHRYIHAVRGHGFKFEQP
jgi:DNA-binding response OmpR family regulator